MRPKLEELAARIQWLGNDIDDKDIELRSILYVILDLLDQALPSEVEPDDANPQ